jgi:hypothetical protein
MQRRFGNLTSSRRNPLAPVTARSPHERKRHAGSGARSRDRRFIRLRSSPDWETLSFRRDDA